MEFKYKKMTTKSQRFYNGEFKFYLDDTLLLSDSNSSNNGWQVFTTNLTHGLHTFYFIYTKWNIRDKTDTMGAELEVTYSH